MLKLVFAPWDGLVRWRGATRWTSRLVVLLLLASLVHNGLADVFAGGRAGGIYFASLLLLAVIAVLVHNCEPFDFAILALTGLADLDDVIAANSHSAADGKPPAALTPK